MIILGYIMFTGKLKYSYDRDIHEISNLLIKTCIIKIFQKNNFTVFFQGN